MAAITRNENFIYYDTFWREEEDEVTQLYSLAYILPYSRFRSKTKEHLGNKYQLFLGLFRCPLMKEGPSFPKSLPGKLPRCQLWLFPAHRERGRSWKHRGSRRSNPSKSRTVECRVQLLGMQFLRYLDGFGKIPAQSKEIPLFQVCSEVQEDEHKPRAYPAIRNVHSSVL